MDKQEIDRRAELGLPVVISGRTYALASECRRSSHGECSVCGHELPSFFCFCAGCGSMVVD